MKVLYIDELLLVNFTAGAAFLLAAGLLAGVRCRGARLAAGAAPFAFQPRRCQVMVHSASPVLSSTPASQTAKPSRS